MQDIDKLPPILQWVVGLGILIGGILAGWFGTRKSKSGDDRESGDRVAREELARALAQINEKNAQIQEDKMRRDWELALKATRQSFYDQAQKITERFEADLKEIERRVLELERNNYRSPSQRR
jgi:hypothetical protein